MSSIEESWLHGNLSTKYQSNYFSHVLDMAREYFKDWSEKEVREFYKDLDDCLNWYIEEFGTRHFLTNKIIIIHKWLYYIANKYNFILFFEKWKAQLQKIKPKVGKETIALENILGALYILKHFSIEDMYKVMEMYSLMHERDLIDNSLLIAEKEGVRKNKVKAAKEGKRKSTTKLVASLIKKHNTCNPETLWRCTKNLPDAIKKQYNISLVDDQQITYYSANKKPTRRINFGSIINKAKKICRS